jgi:LuxR family transcriptional regulator, maltose regulon positive regulatory protein
MSRKTPHVSAGTLTCVDTDLNVEVGSAEWFAWLCDEAHPCFHFTDSSGGFTARKERKQRGDSYWVAYRQSHKKLYKRYLGKSESLTEAHLTEGSAALAKAIALHEHNPAQAADGEEQHRSNEP